MNPYVTGSTIKNLREKRNITQETLGEEIGVSGKTVSKWETGKGLPDISLLEPLAKSLGISLIELLSGDSIENKNPSSNLYRSKFYVCPICGNTIHSMGEIVASCCGITLPPLEAEDPDEDHAFEIERVEDESFIKIHHDMTKEHFISFFAYVTPDQFILKKLYPEGNAEGRFPLRKTGYLYAYCNRHGLMKQKILGINPKSK
ncbi:helix-turn-helix domain-containing protein [Peptoniphilus sp. KCTC 25270]|uniref:helix-turn-helix domain-containing protein n=1 Tax=Peptoniphilus sp. KCTC 25270 TaxID=2897414 RepID=UPI001E392F2C|nr:helix-turn-helix domain-containing protein [Peptoniphilus sp. KCTC 25270]MCD1147516.1 helix-turn-helix domain-containing protein [Peptoniphilus sp. KCTC 25270]